MGFSSRKPRFQGYLPANSSQWGSLALVRTSARLLDVSLRSQCFFCGHNRPLDVQRHVLHIRLSEGWEKCSNSMRFRGFRRRGKRQALALVISDPGASRDLDLRERAESLPTRILDRHESSTPNQTLHRTILAGTAHNTKSLSTKSFGQFVKV